MAAAGLGDLRTIVRSFTVAPPLKRFGAQEAARLRMTIDRAARFKGINCHGALPGPCHFASGYPGAHEKCTKATIAMKLARPFFRSLTN